jgi:hypothetical protein
VTDHGGHVGVVARFNGADHVIGAHGSSDEKLRPGFAIDSIVPILASFRLQRMADISADGNAGR